jgi:DNA adenine methylase
MPVQFMIKVATNLARLSLEEQHISERAASPLSAVPRAFLRWAGSKRLVLPHIVPHLPKQFGTYFEPFLGGGSLFFLLRPSKAVLSDISPELITTYKAIRRSTHSVLRHLAGLSPCPSVFYDIRENRSVESFRRAAEFIYLNKTCWNGLYRVNAAGKFNVPYGRPKSDRLIDVDNLSACGALLRERGISIHCEDFEGITSQAKSGDLIFLDPPYVTGHRNNGFIDYNEVLFSWEDQERLARVARSLRSRGCFVIVTNADHESILEIYQGFKCLRVDRKSTIASHTARRGRTTELVIVGAP